MIVPLHVSSQLRRISSLPSWFRTFRNVLREIPLMSFGICGAVAARTVERIFGLFENCRACPPGPFEVRIHVIYIDVKALRGLTKPFRILVFGTGVTHHDQVLAESHRGVIDLAVGPLHLGAVLPKTKCFLQKLQCSGHTW